MNNEIICSNCGGPCRVEEDDHTRWYRCVDCGAHNGEIGDDEADERETPLDFDNRHERSNN